MMSIEAAATTTHHSNGEDQRPRGELVDVLVHVGRRHGARVRAGAEGAGRAAAVGERQRPRRRRVPRRARHARARRRRAVLVRRAGRCNVLPISAACTKNKPRLPGLTVAWPAREADQRQHAQAVGHVERVRTAQCTSKHDELSMKGQKANAGSYVDRCVLAGQPWHVSLGRRYWFTGHDTAPAANSGAVSKTTITVADQGH